MVVIRIAALGAALALAGCAQGTSSTDITTGSILPAMPSLPAASTLIPTIGTPSGPRKPERISGNLYRIDATDRKIDDPIQRENYTLLRAAESTKLLGGTHFIVVNAPQGGGLADVRQPGKGQTSAIIRVLQISAGAEPPIGAISTDEIIHFFGPTFGRTLDGQATAQAGSPS